MKMLIVSTSAMCSICLLLMFPPHTYAADPLQLFRPLPFAGPYHGAIVDSENGNPIAGATIEIKWMRHDNPLSDGPGHNSIKASARTDSNGLFSIEKQETRGGIFATDVTITVTTSEYIKRVLIIDPKGTPLPQQTIDWPFQDTTVYISLPEPLNVRLKPALPVILKALQSKDPLMRQTAEEEFQKLKNNIQ